MCLFPRGESERSVKTNSEARKLMMLLLQVSSQW